jgi:hypothetical protein
LPVCQGLEPTILKIFLRQYNNLKNRLTAISVSHFFKGFIEAGIHLNAEVKPGWV